MKEFNVTQYKVAETYIKFDFEFSDSNKQLVKKAYREQVRSLGILNLNADFIKISIEFEKGSLKTRITVWGTVAAMYMGIANYGSFRAGLREIVHDVKNLTEQTVSDLKEDPQINNNDVIRFERRLGIPGRLNEIYSKIDHLERNLNNYSQNDIQGILSGIKQEIADISVVLDNQTRLQFINGLPDHLRENLPQPSESGVNFLYNKYALKHDENIEYIN